MRSIAERLLGRGAVYSFVGFGTFFGLLIFNSEVLLRLVEATAWPAAVVFGLWRYEDEVREAMKRLKKAGPTEFFDPIERQEEIAKKRETQEAQIDKEYQQDISDITDNNTAKMQEIENRVKDLLRKLEGNTKDNIAIILARLLVKKDLEAEFKEIFDALTDAQLKLLKYLSAVDKLSVIHAKGKMRDVVIIEPTGDEMRDSYNRKKQALSEIGALVDLGLIKRQEGDPPRRKAEVAITQYGKDFAAMFAEKAPIYWQWP